MVLWKVSGIEIWNLVQICNFIKSVEEVISTNSGLTLEEGQPKDLGVLGLETGQDFGSEIVVNNIFEINFVKVIGPWMKH